MATDIAEALQGAGAISAKPVTMEAIPEATIDVGGGSQSLEIEGLGVKRRKDDLSVTTASTSQLAVEDLFGDLLDEVNFSDPSSVDAFREAAAGRIDEFDSNTFSNILGEASTVASDLATLTSQFQDRPQPQQQFEQVFGPPSVTSGDDAGDIGLDTATSTEAQDISDLSNPGLAAGLVGGAFGAFGPGAGFSGLASNVASGALSNVGVADVFGGFSAAKSLANADITDPASALGAVSNALSVGQRAANIADLANTTTTISSLFDQAAKNVGEYIEGVYTAVTNPEQSLEAYGRQMQFGTLDPQVFTYDLPSGVVGFNFDKKTGELVTPGFITALMPTPIRAAYSLTQFALDKFGYAETLNDRATGMANAFSTAGTSFSAATATSAGMMGFADPSNQSNVTAVDLDFSQQPGAIGGLQFDMSALADQVAGKGFTADNIGIEQVNQAAVVQAYLDYEEIDIANAAIQSAFNDYADSRGLDNNSIESISEAMAQEAMAVSMGYVDAYNSVAEMAGVQGIDVNFGDLANQGMTGMEVSTAAASLSASVAAQVADLQSMGVADLEAMGLSRAGVDAFAQEYGAEPKAFDYMNEPLTAEVVTPTTRAQTLDFAKAFSTSKTVEQEQAIEAAADNAASNSFGYDAGGYNSTNPSNLSIDIAEKTMDITNTNMMDPNNKEQQEVARNVARGMFGVDPEATYSGDLDFGYGETPGSIGPSGVDAPGYEAAGAAAAMDAPGIDFGEGVFDESDTGMDADGSDGGGESTVICTALKDMGLLHKELWQHDGAYGRTLPLETRQGYWAWGVPTAKFIRKNRWAAKAISPVVTEVAKEMAHRVGYGKGSRLGAALLYVGLPMCRVISRIKNNGNNTGSVYS